MKTKISTIFVWILSLIVFQAFGSISSVVVAADLNVDGDINLITSGDDDPPAGLMIDGSYFLRRGYTQNNYIALGVGIAPNYDINANQNGRNIFIGDGAGAGFTHGRQSVVIGYDAGAAGMIAGSKLNVVIGNYANAYGQFGNGNTIIGGAAGTGNTGDYNTFVGSESGSQITTGSRNILIGQNAGTGHDRTGHFHSLITGENNIHLGHHTEASSGDLNSTVALGYFTVVENNSQIVAGSNLFYWDGYRYQCTSSMLPCASDSDCSTGETCEQKQWVDSPEIKCDLSADGYVTTGCDPTDFGSYRDAYFGAGIKTDWLGYEPEHFTLHATGGEGENVRGADLILAGGKSTGSASGGSIRFQTSAAGLSGSDENTLTDKMVIDYKGRVGIGTSTLGGNSNRLTVYRPAGETYVTVKTDTVNDVGIQLVSSDYYAWIYQSQMNDLRLAIGDYDQVIIKPNGNVGIGTESPIYPLEMASGAHVTAGGVWTDASSKDLKENISDFPAHKALETLNGLKPVEFNYKVDKEEKYVGFIAEDVPDTVAMKDRKGLSPMDIVAVLTSVVKEQQKTITELSGKIAKLEKEVKLKGALTMSELNGH